MNIKIGIQMNLISKNNNNKKKNKQKNNNKKHAYHGQGSWLVFFRRGIYIWNLSSHSLLNQLSAYDMVIIII